MKVKERANEKRSQETGGNFKDNKKTLWKMVNEVRNGWGRGLGDFVTLDWGGMMLKVLRSDESRM